MKRNMTRTQYFKLADRALEGPRKAHRKKFKPYIPVAEYTRYAWWFAGRFYPLYVIAQKVDMTPESVYLNFIDHKVEHVWINPILIEKFHTFNCGLSREQFVAFNKH